MKVTLTVKEVNPEFDREYAEKQHDGKESEDNILYNWEDEFEVSGDVKEFKVRNNAPYILHVQMEADKEVKTYEIPSMTLVDCILEDGSFTTCAFSRSLVKDTKKVQHKNGNIHFYVFLKGGKEIVNPITGIYIAAKDFPSDLPLPDDEDGDDDDLVFDEEE
jgi:hypothetical protein